MAADEYRDLIPEVYLSGCVHLLKILLRENIKTLRQLDQGETDRQGEVSDGEKKLDQLCNESSAE